MCQLGGWDWRVTERTVLVQCAKLSLEGIVKEFMPMLAQEDEQLGPLDEPQDRLLGR